MHLRPLSSRHISLFAVTLLLSACSGLSGMHEPTVAEQDALQSLVAQQNRLDRVAAPLLVNNPAICKDNARNLLGFTAKNKYSYSEELSGATHQALGLNERLQVVNVLAGSGAARAGVHKGDGLVAVDDQPLPQGPHAERQAAAIIGPLVTGKQSVKLTVARSGANVALNVPLTLACAFSVELGNSDNVNAYSDGRRIVVTRGMMRFAQTDNELAYVLAKEMAHNVLGQQAKQHISGTMGDIIDNLVLLHPDMSTMNGMAGIKPYTPELDASADNLSLYMAARAGYSVDGAPRFWQRLAQQYPASVLNGYTAIHPMTSSRLSAMDKAAVEVKGKQAAGKPLMPVS
jgi:hypothetical protein